MNTFRHFSKLIKWPTRECCKFSMISAQQQSSTLTEDFKKKPIWFYNNKAIRQRKVNQLLRKAALQVTEHSDKDDDVIHAGRLVEVLDAFDFTQKEILEIFYVKPKIMQLSKGVVRKRLHNFSLLELPKDVIKRMVVKCPSLLMLEQEKSSLQKRLNNMQEITLQPRLTQERCLYIIQKTPQVLLVEEKSNFNAKIKNLKELGFNEQQIFELVMKHPAILTYKAESVKEKVEYITDKVGGRLALFVKFPRVFTASTKRLKERCNYLRGEGYITKNTRLTENKLRAIVLTKDSDFVYRVTNTKMKDFRSFQKNFQEGTIDIEDFDVFDMEDVTNDNESFTTLEQTSS